MTELTPKIIAAMRAVDTPTICNALELIDPANHAAGFTRRPIVCAFPKMKPIIGFARTAKIRCSKPAVDPKAVVRARRMDYYRYVADGPRPAVVVIEDEDEEPGVGSFWGEVHSAVHKGLKLEGVITNGSIRDLDALSPGFQLIAGSIMPSHAYVHPVAFDVPVTVFGLTVRTGDLIHADRHGAVRIAPQYIKELPRAIKLTTRKEEPILKAARGRGFSVDKLIKAWGAADDVH